LVKKRDMRGRTIQAIIFSLAALLAVSLVCNGLLLHKVRRYEASVDATLSIAASRYRQLESLHRVLVSVRDGGKIVSADRRPGRYLADGFAAVAPFRPLSGAEGRFPFCCEYMFRLLE
jgi:hypothetical protein